MKRKRKIISWIVILLAAFLNLKISEAAGDMWSWTSFHLGYLFCLIAVIVNWFEDL